MSKKNLLSKKDLRRYLRKQKLTVKMAYLNDCVSTFNINEQAISEDYYVRKSRYTV